jgi:hypothetical protein
MNKAFSVAALTGALSVGIVYAQSKPTTGRRSARSTSHVSVPSHEEVPTKAMTLATVHVPRAVKADDQLLKAGTYQVRLTGEPLKPVVGETPNLEQWVEFLQDGKVKARAAASIVPAPEIHRVIKERMPPPGHARVDVLKGNEYLRVWINKDGNHYLIHMPMATS